MKSQGGLKNLKDTNYEKAKLLYDMIDKSNFYRAPVDAKCRSIMNVRIEIWPQGDTRNNDLEKKFVEEATKQRMLNLKGHRSLGGLRASIYNAQTLENCRRLVEFMENFASANQDT